MLVDFYQLESAPVERVAASLCEKVLAEGSRLLILAEDQPFLARLDRQLWDQGPTSFLPHGLAGGADDARQPILLSTTPDAPNGARNLLIADGQWREAALGYERTFYLFGPDALQAAREAWRSLAGREGITRRHWVHGSSGWVQKS